MSEGKPRHGRRLLDLDLGLLAGARAPPFPGKSSPGRGDRGSLSLAGGNWPPRAVASGPRSSADLDRLRSVCGRIPAGQHQSGRSPPPEGASRPEWGLRQRGKFHGPPRKDKYSATAVFPQGRRPSPSHRLSGSRSSSTPSQEQNAALATSFVPDSLRLSNGKAFHDWCPVLSTLTFRIPCPTHHSRRQLSRAFTGRSVPVFPTSVLAIIKTKPRDRRVHFSTEFFWM